MKRERAMEILAGQSFGQLHGITAAEDAEIKARWRSLPGWTCYADAVAAIAYPERWPSAASYRLVCYGQDEQLEEARFATRAEAEEVATATEYGGDGYLRPKVVESADPPTISAGDYMAAVWPEYPGPCPAGTDTDEWFSGAAD